MSKADQVAYLMDRFLLGSKNEQVLISGFPVGFWSEPVEGDYGRPPVGQTEAEVKAGAIEVEIGDEQEKSGLDSFETGEDLVRVILAPGIVEGLPREPSCNLIDADIETQYLDQGSPQPPCNSDRGLVCWYDSDMDLS